jgi:hypothetical protein
MNDPAYTIKRGKAGRTAVAPNLSKKGRSASAQGIFYRAPAGRQAKIGAPSSSGLNAQRGPRGFPSPTGRPESTAGQSASSKASHLAGFWGEA